MNLKATIARTDRWSFKFALVSATIVAALAIVCRLPGSVSFFLIPLVVLGYWVAAIAILAVATYCVIKKRPRRAGSILLVLLLPLLLWKPLNWTADLVHLGLTVGFGIGELGSSSKSGNDTFADYDWSVGLAGANTFLIHDMSDEIRLPIPQYRHPSSEEDGLAEECAGKVQHLIKHYYVCDF